MDYSYLKKEGKITMKDLLKNLVKKNIIMEDLLPIGFFSMVALITGLFYDIKCVIIVILGVALYFWKLMRNLNNFKKVLDTIDTLEEIIFQSKEVILGKNSIISLKNDIFALDYNEIEEVYLERQYTGTIRDPEIHIITKSHEKYKIMFFRDWSPFPVFHKEDIKFILKTIKEYNPKVKQTGDTIKKYLW